MAQNWINLVHVYPEVGLSQTCSKICQKCFWKFPKIFIYYALHVFHYACIVLQYEQC